MPVKARPSGGSWIVRVLARPLAWADAASVTVVSFSLAGQGLPCECLPATLQRGYDHTPMPAGAVFEAARVGDVRALQATLDAGGSTEEANTVRVDKWMMKSSAERRRMQNNKHSPFQYLDGFTPRLILHHSRLCAPFCRRTAGLPATWPPAMATSRPSARFLRQAQTRPQQAR